MKIFNSRKLKRTIMFTLTAVMCVLATGCMGGQKDIKKAEEEMYTAVVAEACEEYGYEFEKETVFPLGAELLYSISNGEKDIEITVNIDEESTSGKVSCLFTIIRSIDSADDRTTGIDQHLDVLLKIAEHFTDDITRENLIAFLNNEGNWISGKNDDSFIMDKTDGNMTHTIYAVDSSAGEYKAGDPLEELFTFGWDNGKEYKLKGSQ